MTDCLKLLRAHAGSDGRLSDDDIKTAARAAPQTAKLVDAFSEFLRETSKANGRQMVVMSNPLGTRETSAARIVDMFLAAHSVPPPSAAPTPAPAQKLKAPAPADVSRMISVLADHAGRDAALGDNDLAAAYEANPGHVALLAQLGTFLKASASARGGRLSMKDPLGDGSSRTHVRDAFLAHFATLEEPAEPIRAPKNGQTRPIPGTRDVNAPPQTYQYGQWLEFEYLPEYMPAGSGCRQYDATADVWRYERTPPTKVKAQLAWERKNPELAAALRARAAPRLREARYDAIDAAREAEYAREAALERAALAADPWSTQHDNFAVRLRQERERIGAVLRGDPASYRGPGAGVPPYFAPTEPAGRAVHTVGLPDTTVVDGSGRTVHVVDAPAMTEIDTRRGDINGYLDSVDARWSARTNGGTFRYGGGVR